VVEEIAGAIRSAAKDAKASVGKLAGIGVGSPGAVSADSGMVQGAANLPGFEEPVPLAALIGEALDVERVRIDNDVNVGTLAEHQLGAGRGFDDLLAVFAGSGVGGGLAPGSDQPRSADHKGPAMLGRSTGPLRSPAMLGRSTGPLLSPALRNLELTVRTTASASLWWFTGCRPARPCTGASKTREESARDKAGSRQRRRQRQGVVHPLQVHPER
jgi:hypothetical protein